MTLKDLLTHIFYVLIFLVRCLFRFYVHFNVFFLLVCRIYIHKGNESSVKYIHASQLHGLFLCFYWCLLNNKIWKFGCSPMYHYFLHCFTYYIRRPGLPLKSWWYAPWLTIRNSIVLLFILWYMLWGMWLSSTI